MWHIRSFYIFKKQSTDVVDQLELKLKQWSKELDVLGLAIIGEEGLNTTITGTAEGLDQFWKNIRDFFGQETSVVNDSTSERKPFRRFRVRRRPEIVTLGREEYLPNLQDDTHLEPEQWHKAIQAEDAVVIDTRNWYETKIGKFKNALDPKIAEFTQFSEFVESANIPKDKKVYIYCTGGIRCEKGIVEFKSRGFENVYQLKGGILNYLKKFPNEQFEGECFVFDHRMAIDQNLQPSERYHMCAHCGQPAHQKLACKRCDSMAFVCETCLELSAANSSCSKNCAHQLTLDPAARGERQRQGTRYQVLMELGLDQTRTNI